MHTNVTIIGQRDEKPTLKPIKFLFSLTASFEKAAWECHPASFKFVELIARDYGQKIDLMFAHNGVRSAGILYGGHFNDGVVAE